MPTSLIGLLVTQAHHTEMSLTEQGLLNINNRSIALRQAARILQAAERVEIDDADVMTTFRLLRTTEAVAGNQEAEAVYDWVMEALTVGPANVEVAL